MTLYRVSFTPALDTNQYAANDVLFITTAVRSSPRDSHPVWLRAVTVRDKDDQKQGINLYFIRANASAGTINTAVAISDANADYVTGFVEVAAGDWNDLGGVAVACKTDLNVPVQPVDGDVLLYVFGECSSGTPTYTASGVTIDLWIEM